METANHFIQFWSSSLECWPSAEVLCGPLHQTATILTPTLTLPAEN